jgi:hypothetical protein
MIGTGVFLVEQDVRRHDQVRLMTTIEDVLGTERMEQSLSPYPGLMSATLAYADKVAPEPMIAEVDDILDQCEERMEERVNAPAASGALHDCPHRKPDNELQRKSFGLGVGQCSELEWDDDVDVWTQVFVPPGNLDEADEALHERAREAVAAAQSVRDCGRFVSGNVARIYYVSYDGVLGYVAQKGAEIPPHAIEVQPLPRIEARPFITNTLKTYNSGSPTRLYLDMTGLGFVRTYCRRPELGGGVLCIDENVNGVLDESATWDNPITQFRVFDNKNSFAPCGLDEAPEGEGFIPLVCGGQRSFALKTVDERGEPRWLIASSKPERGIDRLSLLIMAIICWFLSVIVLSRATRRNLRGSNEHERLAQRLAKLGWKLRMAGRARQEDFTTFAEYEGDDGALTEVSVEQIERLRESPAYSRYFGRDHDGWHVIVESTSLDPSWPVVRASHPVSAAMGEALEAQVSASETESGQSP